MPSTYHSGKTVIKQLDAPPSTPGPGVQEAPSAHPSSFDKLQWAFKLQSNKKLTPSGRRVIVVLAARHNSTTGRCDPSVPGIAEDSGISERMAYKALDELKAAGLIDWVSGGEKVRNKYTLLDVPHWDFQTKTTTGGTPAKRGEGPASSSRTNVIPFPGPAQDSQSETEGAEPKFRGGMNSSSGEGLNSSSPEPLNLQSPKEISSPLSPSSASDGPVAPFSPSTGHQGPQDSTHTNQPDTKVERQTKPRETTWPNTLLWSKEIRDMATDAYAGPVGKTVQETFYAFKAHAMKNSWRRTDWHKAWRDWYREAGRIENAKRKGPAI
ncbi:helix-turn-helix domain-containing protein [Methylobacterium sp. WL64]|uniref:helix-turn-helix domain-containing protein n=1 Tax=Methylobacterium sp. WL64 TaxID=2603894 RepID=UPI0011C8002B|nr:helix-turn-helix domain-containing protein [Methylobacterium sp. WL64]TXN04206.1 helix-turn-helix domain-containing protein [Methylobacterium sp. WL64]